MLIPHNKPNYEASFKLKPTYICYKTAAGEDGMGKYTRRRAIILKAISLKGIYPRVSSHLFCYEDVYEISMRKIYFRSNSVVCMHINSLNNVHIYTCVSQPGKLQL